MNMHKILEEIAEQVKNELANRPDQFVVAYYKQGDDSLIGYHLSSFNQLTQDILEAKRYSGTNPYGQLEVIAHNLKDALDKQLDPDNPFYEVLLLIREDYKGLNSKDIYLDAIYLAEGTPRRNFKYTIL